MLLTYAYFSVYMFCDCTLAWEGLQNMTMDALGAWREIQPVTDRLRPIVHERPQNKNSWTKEEVVPNAL